MGFLRRSQSSFEFKSFLHVGKLRAVKEHEDELTLPYEPQGRRDDSVIRFLLIGSILDGRLGCVHLPIVSSKGS